MATKLSEDRQVSAKLIVLPSMWLNYVDKAEENTNIFGKSPHSGCVTHPHNQFDNFG